MPTRGGAACTLHTCSMVCARAQGEVRQNRMLVRYCQLVFSQSQSTIKALAAAKRDSLTKADREFIPYLQQFSSYRDGATNWKPYPSSRSDSRPSFCPARPVECHHCKLVGQVDLAETDENGNENERGNENEKGNGRQEGSKCGIGRRSCKPTLLCKIAWCIQRLVTGSRQAAHASYINYIRAWANILLC